MFDNDTAPGESFGDQPKIDCRKKAQQADHNDLALTGSPSLEIRLHFVQRMVAQRASYLEEMIISHNFSNLYFRLRSDSPA